MNTNNNSITTNGGEGQPNRTHRKAAAQSPDQFTYRSPDGQVEIVTKGDGALRRFPPSNYKVVCLHLRPRPGSRVQQLDDGSGGLDVLLSHREAVGHLKALNLADPKAQYTYRDIPEKSEERKAHWRRVNQERLVARKTKP